jgi:hypothetical protein
MTAHLAGQKTGSGHWRARRSLIRCTARSKPVGAPTDPRPGMARRALARLARSLGSVPPAPRRYFSKYMERR